MRRKDREITDFKKALEILNTCDCSFLYQSVMGTGKVRLLENPEEKADALTHIVKHYEKDFNGTFPLHALDGVAIIELSVNKWSCKEHI